MSQPLTAKLIPSHPRPLSLSLCLSPYTPTTSQITAQLAENTHFSSAPQKMTLKESTSNINFACKMKKIAICRGIKCHTLFRRCDFKGFEMGCIRSAGSNNKAIFPHLFCLVGSLVLVLPSLDSLLVVFTCKKTSSIICKPECCLSTQMSDNWDINFCSCQYCGHLPIFIRVLYVENFP